MIIVAASSPIALYVWLDGSFCLRDSLMLELGDGNQLGG